MTNPVQHAARRKLFARPFSKTHLRDHWESAVREKVQLAVSRMQDDARSSSDGVVDVMKWWTFMASDISSHLMFGESFHTLDHGEVNEYLRALTNALKGGGIGAEMPLVREIGRRLPFRSAKELFGSNAIVDVYGRTAVANMKASGGARNIFANMMAAAEKGERLDDRDVELEATNLIVAGTDTTAISLTYLIYAVLSQPALQKLLEAELAHLPESYTDANLEGLPLLSAVIEETWVALSIACVLADPCVDYVFTVRLQVCCLARSRGVAWRWMATSCRRAQLPRLRAIAYTEILSCFQIQKSILIHLQAGMRTS